MNCEEVQTRISDYLERSLDAISMKSIEVHLSSCSRCRVDTDSLSDCLQEVARLPMVDPPLGFTQRVMAHVREIDKKPTLWERLFLPMRVKIPVQATAVVLIGVLALVLSQKEEQLDKQDFSQPAATALNSLAPSAQTSNQAKDSTIVVERSVQDNKPPAKSTKPFVDLAKQASEQLRTSKAATPPAGGEQTQPAAAPHPSSARESESRLEDKKETPRRRPIPAQEVSTAGEAMRSRRDTFGLGAGAGAMSQDSLSAGPLLERSLSPLSEPNADIEFVVRRRPVQRRDEKDEPSVAQSGESRRTNPPLAASRTSSVREIRWFTVAADRFEQFKKALESEAIIESEKTLGIIESDFAQKIARELLIKVTISASE